MNDSEFLNALETCTLPPGEFTHEAHIRMAWLYLRREGYERGCAVIRESIQRYARALGATRKYHETITQFWAWVVQMQLESAPEIDTYEAFADAFPDLYDASLILRHYSRDLLASDAARAAWVEPDVLRL